MRKILIVIIGLIISSSLITLFIYNRSVTEVQVPEDVLNKIIIGKVEPNTGIQEKNANISCDYSVICLEEKYGQINVYLSLLCTIDYQDSSNRLSGRGVMPAVIHLNKKNNNYTFKSFEISLSDDSSISNRIYPSRIKKNYNICPGNFKSPRAQKKE